VQPVELNSVASTILVISYLIGSLVLTVLLGIVVYLLLKLNTLMTTLVSRADPTLDKADEVLTVVTEKISVIGDRTEGILSQGEAVAETVHDRVDRTSGAVQRTIHAPLIGLNSLAAGLTRGLSTFSRLQQKASSTDGSSRTDYTREPTETEADSVRSMTRVAIPAGAATGKEFVTENGRQ